MKNTIKILIVCLFLNIGLFAFGASATETQLSKMEQAIWGFEYSKENNIRYKYKHKALGLENILYYCPHCHKEHTMFTKGNKIMCKMSFQQGVENLCKRKSLAKRG